MASDSLVKVLMIDDDSTQHVLAKEYLGTAGFTVRIAEDGQRGLNLAASTSPNIILLDLVLPTVDGYAICEQLKRNPETADIPIVLVTASRNQDVIKRGLDAGATDFVTKPLDWEFLADRVKHVLHQHENKVTRHPRSPNEAAQFDAVVISEKDREIAALHAALADAKGKIATLNEEAPTAKERPAVQIAEADWSDLEEQIGEIEKEWSVRLQEAVTQANKRADQRYQKLKLSLDDTMRENDVALQQLNRQLDLANQDKQALLQQKNELVEVAARQAELESLTQQQAEQQRLEFAEQSANIWGFIEAKTERQRHTLRDTQARIAQLRKLAGDAPESEELHGVIDQVDVVMSSSAMEINKLRNLALHASGATEYKNDSFCLKRLMDELAKNTCARVGRNDVSINNGLQSELTVAADRDAVATIMQGLLENALQHSPPNSSVEMHSAQDDERGLVIRIVDHGFGIDSALLKDIELFLDAETSSVPTNVKLFGSGLPMAKKITQHHGGGLAIESVLGKGTTVLLNFPIAVVTEAPAPGDNFGLRAVS